MDKIILASWLQITSLRKKYSVPFASTPPVAWFGLVRFHVIWRAGFLGHWRWPNATGLHCFNVWTNIFSYLTFFSLFLCCAYSMYGTCSPYLWYPLFWCRGWAGFGDWGRLSWSKSGFPGKLQFVPLLYYPFLQSPVWLIRLANRKHF